MSDSVKDEIAFRDPSAKRTSELGPNPLPNWVLKVCVILGVCLGGLDQGFVVSYTIFHLPTIAWTL